MLEFLSNTSLNKESDAIEIEIKKYFSIEVQDVESIDWWQQHKEVKKCIYIL